MIRKDQNIIKIAITGPESTGKSTIAQQLARHYNTVWVPEFSRSYIDNLDEDYVESDLLEIAKGQIEIEKRMLKDARRLIFFDTELLVMKIWSQHKYGRVHPWILSKYHEVKYDYYLLTDVDLPWVDDLQRENPGKGKFFYNWFEQELHEKNVIFDVVSGDEDKRLETAIQLINNRFDLDPIQQ